MMLIRKFRVILASFLFAAVTFAAPSVEQIDEPAGSGQVLS
jgi:hypothetical protein